MQPAISTPYPKVFSEERFVWRSPPCRAGPVDAPLSRRADEETRLVILFWEKEPQRCSPECWRSKWKGDNACTG